MEHQADLIALANDIRLKERRPINLDDRELVANNYSRFHGWMSGGNNADARRFFESNGLVDFYWGMGGPGTAGFLWILWRRERGAAFPRQLSGRLLPARPHCPLRRGTGH